MKTTTIILLLIILTGCIQISDAAIKIEDQCNLTITHQETTTIYTLNEQCEVKLNVHNNNSTT